MSLTGWLLEQLHELRHSNGKQRVRIFGPLDLVGVRATIALNFLDPDGEPVDFRHTEACAARQHLAANRLATATQARARSPTKSHKTSWPDASRAIRRFLTPSYTSGSNGTAARRPTRCAFSLGVASSFADVYRFMHFAQQFKIAGMRRLRPAAKLDPHAASEPDLA